MELARALGQHPAVYRVDLLTRLIKDPKVSHNPCCAPAALCFAPFQFTLFVVDCPGTMYWQQLWASASIICADH